MRAKKSLRMGLAAALLLSTTLASMAQEEKPKREGTEWLDVFMPNNNDSSLPRILLIGNSLTRGYYPEVVKLLEGKAYVARLTTTKSICDPALKKEIDLIMSYAKFDIVQFNNGLHGFGYTEEQYKQAFPGFVKTIRDNAPGAKLMWATLTPLHTRADAKIFLPNIDRIKMRNKIALDYVTAQKDIRVDDLWAVVIDHPEYYQGGDGAHPVPAGYTALAQNVAAELMAILNEKK